MRFFFIIFLVIILVLITIGIIFAIKGESKNTKIWGIIMFAYGILMIAVIVFILSIILDMVKYA